MFKRYRRGLNPLSGLLGGCEIWWADALWWYDDTSPLHWVLAEVCEGWLQISEQRRREMEMV
jgi:hypothetical protein